MATTDLNSAESGKSESQGQDQSQGYGSGSSVGYEDFSENTLGDSVDQIKNELARAAEDFFSGQKCLVSKKCREISHALKHAGDSLRSGDEHALVQVVELPDKQVQRFSHYIDCMEANSVLPEMESAIQRNPVLFLGGALALGFFIGRLLKAPEQATRAEERLP